MTIKQHEQEINSLKKRLAELDQKPQSQTKIFDDVEQELKNLFVGVESRRNCKNGTR